MALERWNPFRELDGMRREMDKMWEEIFPRGRRQFMGLPWPAAPEKAERVARTPVIDLIDRQDEVLVIAEMPGVAKDGVDVAMQESVLTIRGESKDAELKQGETPSYSERGRGSYARSIEIPFKIDQERIKAVLKDGLLCVHLPKAVEVQPRRIKVEID
jgi:HSP20 family protein